MKRYCLTNRAKKQLSEIVGGVLALVALVLFIVTFIAMIDVLLQPGLYLPFQYYGIVCWWVLISFLIQQAGKWLLNAFEPCRR